MAMSMRERKQRQLERDREQMKRLDDSTYPFLHQPFFEHTAENPNWSSFTLPLELAGFEEPLFEDDRGPEDYAKLAALPPAEEPAEAFTGTRGSIGRAEVMVELLLEAASELATIVNTYKRQELSARREEMEAADLSDSEDRKQALKDFARIAKIEAELDKSVRRTIPQWKVKGL